MYVCVIHLLVRVNCYTFIYHCNTYMYYTDKYMFVRGICKAISFYLSVSCMDRLLHARNNQMQQFSAYKVTSIGG